jgi:hypothetical protein
MIEIIPLDSKLIELSNNNSFGGTRGKNSNNSYLSYCNEILGWEIADSKKEKLLKDIHKKYSDILRYEAQHVSVMVAGPAKYNAKKLDKSDQVLRLSAEFSEWFKSIKKQVFSSSTLVNDETAKEKRVTALLKEIEWYHTQDMYAPTKELIELATVDNKKFIELFESLLDRYRWRKNSNIYKLYVQSKVGEVQEVNRETVFEDDNLIAFKEGDRYYIKFVLKPKRQLIVALKSRGWWWNARQNAWSTYLNKFNLEWVSRISEQYEKYI